MSMYETLVDEGRAAEREAVRVEHRGDRAVVTLVEPDKLNPLSAAVVQQLKAALTALAADRGVRAIVLTGTDPAFTAGGDLRMMETAVAKLAEPPGTTDIWRWIRNEFGGIARLIARTDKAIIAAINGPAAGVGLAWALTCDVAVASERAVIVPAFGRLGLVPEVGTSWALTRALGYQGAFAFFASGKHLDGAAAQGARARAGGRPARRAPRRRRRVVRPHRRAAAPRRCRWPSRCCVRRPTRRGRRP